MAGPRKATPAKAPKITAQLRELGVLSEILRKAGLAPDWQDKCLLWPEWESGETSLVLQYETEDGINRQVFTDFELNADQLEAVRRWLVGR